jgi:TPP-dependent pyruvate/acetoin dehydrogenase alpha subunit
VHQEVTQDVQAGIAFAEASPMPDPATLLDDVYA